MKTNMFVRTVNYSVCCFLILFTTPSFAQGPGSHLLTQAVKVGSQGDVLEYAIFKDWSVECRTSGTSDESRCEMNTPVLIETIDKKISSAVSIKLIFEKANKPAIAVIQTPLELLLSKGIELEIDSRKLGKLTYRSCHATGCLAPFSVSGGIRRAMLNGLSAKLALYNLEGDAKKYQFSLLGISNAVRYANFYLK